MQHTAFNIYACVQSWVFARVFVCTGAISCVNTHIHVCYNVECSVLQCLHSPSALTQRHWGNAHDCTHTCTHKHTLQQTNTHVYAYSRRKLHQYKQIHEQTLTIVRTHKYTRAHACACATQTHMHTYQIHTRTHTYARTSTYTYARTHARTYAHTTARTHTLSLTHTYPLPSWRSSRNSPVYLITRQNAYASVWVCVCVQMCHKLKTCAPFSQQPKIIHTNANTSTHTHAWIHTHTHTHAHMHTHAHTNAHTHTRT